MGTPEVGTIIIALRYGTALGRDGIRPLHGTRPTLRRCYSPNRFRMPRTELK
jgi:hypothetical protein